VNILVIAEEMLGRGPFTNRGILALAVVSWIAASIAIFHALRRPPASTEPVGQNAVLDQRSPIERTRALLGTTPFRLMQVAFGILLVAAIGSSAGLASRPAPVLPAGWSILHSGQEVSSLEMLDDVLWIGGMAGLSAIDRRTLQDHALPGGTPPFRYIRDLHVDRAGAMWVAHGKGIARMIGGRWEEFSAAQGLPSSTGLGVFEDRAGTVWAGLDDGVFQFDGRQFIRVLANFGANAIFQSRDGVIWFGSDDPEHGGLRSFDGHQWTNWSDRLAHRSVNAIAEDRSGAIWFATGFSSSGGATKVDRGAWSSINQKDGLAGGKVRSVYEDHSGRLWFGSEYDGIAVTDRSLWRIVKPQDGLAGFEVKQMLQEATGVYWLGTESGLSRIERFELEREGR